MPRKREVFKSYGALCEAWATRAQERGRTPNAAIRGTYHHGSRLTFESDILYSYGHWPIARHVKPGVVLVTTDYWSTTVKRSPTTEKHKREAFSAARRARLTVYEVPNLDRSQEAMLEALKENALECIAKVKSARYPGRFRWQLDDFFEQLRYCSRFAKEFDLPYDRRWIVPHLGELTRKRLATFKRIRLDRIKERLIGGMKNER